jgi:ABC-type phosphate/phosphonate transport system permease subunit
MVIGFVGGDGIGYYLSQQINSLIGYHKAGIALWAIVIVVWAMDFLFRGPQANNVIRCHRGGPGRSNG